MGPFGTVSGIFRTLSGPFGTLSGLFETLLGIFGTLSGPLELFGMLSVPFGTL